MSGANKTILAIIIILLLTIGVYYYTRTGSNYNPYSYPTPSAPSASYTPTLTPTPTPTPAPSANPSSTATPKPSASPTLTPTPSPITYNISAVEFRYSPNTITAKAGQAITIVFSNNGAAPHNLTFEGVNAATRTLNPGQTDTVQFTAPAAGTYTFFCSVDSHRDLGLQGTLTVQ